MAAISFGEKPESVWIVAGWAFRQVLEDLKPLVASEPGILDAIDSADPYLFLNMADFDSHTREIFISALSIMAKGILDGMVKSTISQKFADPESEVMYREGLRMLLSAIKNRGAGELLL